MIIPILACDDEYRHICVNKSVNRGATLAADISNMQGGNVPKVSEETRQQWAKEIADKVQRKVERSSKRMDWAERLEKAAKLGLTDEAAKEAEETQDGEHKMKKKKNKEKDKKEKEKGKSKKSKKRHRSETPDREKNKKR